MPEADTMEVDQPSPGHLNPYNCLNYSNYGSDSNNNAPQTSRRPAPLSSTPPAVAAQKSPVSNILQILKIRLGYRIQGFLSATNANAIEDTSAVFWPRHQERTSMCLKALGALSTIQLSLTPTQSEAVADTSLTLFKTGKNYR
jgi:hypothetical protein